MPALEAYPAEQSVDVALRDGSTAHVRPVTPADREALEGFLRSMSCESLYLRCFGAADVSKLSDWAADVDYGDRYGVLATIGNDESVVAHAAYVRVDEHAAEVAFEVADELHGHGLATLLLAHLAGVAARHGIRTFTAQVLPSNHKMIEVFRMSGFPAHVRHLSDVVEVELPTALSAETLDAFDRRTRAAAVSAVRHVLAPESIAVVGASRRAGTVGAMLLANIIENGYRGAVYPINPHARRLHGLRCHGSVSELSEPPELAVIAVPAPQVLDAARDCADTGVRALVVISAGFAEAGEEGAGRQHELLAICRRAGMRLVGPNCLGVVNTDPNVQLDATFAADRPPAGRVGFLSQSGGLGIALIEEADRLGLGVSSFVSVGNKADLSGNDLLEFWEQDPGTDVILMYLESFGNPRRFARVARRVSRSKPILAVKSGRTQAGARAAASHTAALVSASDVSVDALFRQAGVIRVDSMGELLGAASLLGSQPLPRGRRVAIVTNGGGPGILCADACQSAGLEVVELPARLRRQLARCLPEGASVSNPIDMIATAGAADYRRVIEMLDRADACDAIVTLFVPPLKTSANDVRADVRLAAEHAAWRTTILSVYMDRRVRGTENLDDVAVPEFPFPEDAVAALAHATRYAAWRVRPTGQVTVAAQPARELGASIIERALDRGDGWLAPADAQAVLDAYELPLVAARTVKSAADAVDAATELGFPVVLKAIAPELIHKTEAGGVRLGLKSRSEVVAAAREIRKAARAAGHRLQGFVVQRMAEPGVELLAGVVHDSSFGPLVAIGAGGVNAELLGDVALRITPVTDLDATEMVRSLRCYPLLEGYRGSPSCDVRAIERVLVGLSALVDAHAEIVELDANPVIAGPSGAVIVDARIRVARASAPRPLAALRDG